MGRGSPSGGDANAAHMADEVEAAFKIDIPDMNSYSEEQR
jgi:hypothetical protein